MKNLFQHRAAGLACLWFSLCLARIGSAGAQEAGSEKKYGQDLYFDFQGKPLSDDLALVGIEADRLVRPEREGLRITSPDGQALRGPVGVGTQFRVQGDFEITATVEILRADPPEKGFGVGVTLFINKSDPPTDGTNIGRLMRPKGDKIMWDRRYDRPGEEPKFGGNSQPCTEKLVRLRLVRTGKQLAYLWAAGARGGEFNPLHQNQYGDEEVNQVMLRARTEGPYKLDVRLIDLRIRSASVARANGGPAARPLEDSPVRGSKVWLVMLITLTLTISLAVALWLRKRRGESGCESPRP